MAQYGAGLTRGVDVYKKAAPKSAVSQVLDAIGGPGRGLQRIVFSPIREIFDAIDSDPNTKFSVSEILGLSGTQGATASELFTEQPLLKRLPAPVKIPLVLGADVLVDPLNLLSGPIMVGVKGARFAAKAAAAADDVVDVVKAGEALTTAQKARVFYKTLRGTATAEESAQLGLKVGHVYDVKKAQQATLASGRKGASRAAAELRYVGSAQAPEIAQEAAGITQTLSVRLPFSGGMAVAIPGTEGIARVVSNAGGRALRGPFARMMDWIDAAKLNEVTGTAKYDISRTGPALRRAAAADMYEDIPDGMTRVYQTRDGQWTTSYLKGIEDSVPEVGVGYVDVPTSQLVSANGKIGNLDPNLLADENIAFRPIPTQLLETSTAIKAYRLREGVAAATGAHMVRSANKAGEAAGMPNFQREANTAPNLYLDEVNVSGSQVEAILIDTISRMGEQLVNPEVGIGLPQELVDDWMTSAVAFVKDKAKEVMDDPKKLRDAKRDGKGLIYLLDEEGRRAGDMVAAFAVDGVFAEAAAVSKGLFRYANLSETEEVKKATDAALKAAASWVDEDGNPIEVFGLLTGQTSFDDVKKALYGLGYKRDEVEPIIQAIRGRVARETRRAIDDPYGFFSSLHDKSLEQLRELKADVIDRNRDLVSVLEDAGIDLQRLGRDEDRFKAIANLLIAGDEASMTVDDWQFMAELLDTSQMQGSAFARLMTEDSSTAPVGPIIPKLSDDQIAERAAEGVRRYMQNSPRWLGAKSPEEYAEKRAAKWLADKAAAVEARKAAEEARDAAKNTVRKLEDDIDGARDEVKAAYDETNDVDAAVTRLVGRGGPEEPPPAAGGPRPGPTPPAPPAAPSLVGGIDNVTRQGEGYLPGLHDYVFYPSTAYMELPKGLNGIGHHLRMDPEQLVQFANDNGFVVLATLDGPTISVPPNQIEDFLAKLKEWRSFKNKGGPGFPAGGIPEADYTFRVIEQDMALRAVHPDGIKVGSLAGGGDVNLPLTPERFQEMQRLFGANYPLTDVNGVPVLEIKPNRYQQFEDYLDRWLSAEASDAEYNEVFDAWDKFTEPVIQRGKAALEGAAGNVTEAAKTGFEDPLIIIACGGSKLDRAAPAAELYTGPLFKSSLAWARSVAPDDRIRILSAKHGLVRLDEVLEPYDVRLGDPGSKTVVPENVKQQAKDQGLYGQNVVVVGGQQYSDFVNDAMGGWTKVHAPFTAGRGAQSTIEGKWTIGKARQAMNRNAGTIPGIEGYATYERLDEEGKALLELANSAEAKGTLTPEEAATYRAQVVEEYATTGQLDERGKMMLDFIDSSERQGMMTAEQAAAKRAEVGDWYAQQATETATKTPQDFAALVEEEGVTRATLQTMADNGTTTTSMTQEKFGEFLEQMQVRDVRNVRGMKVTFSNGKKSRVTLTVKSLQSPDRVGKSAWITFEEVSPSVVVYDTKRGLVYVPGKGAKVATGTAEIPPSLYGKTDLAAVIVEPTADALAAAKSGASEALSTGAKKASKVAAEEAAAAVSPSGWVRWQVRGVEGQSVETKLRALRKAFDDPNLQIASDGYIYVTRERYDLAKDRAYREMRALSPLERKASTPAYDAWQQITGQNRDAKTRWEFEVTPPDDVLEAAKTATQRSAVPYAADEKVVQNVLNRVQLEWEAAGDTSVNPFDTMRDVLNSKRTRADFKAYLRTLDATKKVAAANNMTVDDLIDEVVDDVIERWLDELDGASLRYDPEDPSTWLKKTDKGSVSWKGVVEPLNAYWRSVREAPLSKVPQAVKDKVKLGETLHEKRIIGNSLRDKGKQLAGQVAQQTEAATGVRPKLVETGSPEAKGVMEVRSPAQAKEALAGMPRPAAGAGAPPEPPKPPSFEAAGMSPEEWNNLRLEVQRYADAKASLNTAREQRVLADKELSLKKLAEAQFRDADPVAGSPLYEQWRKAYEEAVASRYKAEFKVVSENESKRYNAERAAQAAGEKIRRERDAEINKVLGKYKMQKQKAAARLADLERQKREAETLFGQVMARELQFIAAAEQATDMQLLAIEHMRNNVGKATLTAKTQLQRLGVTLNTAGDADATFIEMVLMLDELNQKLIGQATGMTELEIGKTSFLVPLSVKQMVAPKRGNDQFNALTKLWRAMAIMRPGFSNRNFIGAWLNNRMQGVVYDDYAKAAVLVSRLLKDEALPSLPGYMSTEDFWEAVVVLTRDGQRFGDASAGVSIFGKGQGWIEAMSTWLDKNSIAKQTYVGGRRTGKDSFRKEARAAARELTVEQQVRMANYIGLRRQGLSHYDAIDQVFAVHFDYSDLSSLDQKIRKWVPFWTYRSRTLALHAQLLVHTPEAVRALWVAREDLRDQGGENLPPWLSGLQLPWGDTVLDFNFVPAGDAIRMADVLGGWRVNGAETLGTFASQMLGGIAPTIAEGVFNRDLFTQNRIYQSSDPAPQQFGDVGWHVLRSFGLVDQLYSTPKGLADGSKSAGERVAGLVSSLGLTPTYKNFTPN